MRKNVPFKLTSLLAVAAMPPIICPTVFALADLSNDDDSGGWGDPVED
jgi:hypothetical protein